MTPGRLVEAVRSHLRLARRRVAGRPVVRISDDTGERVGQRMIVEIVTDDMPFLVESVLSGISRAGVYVQRVIHPIVVVRRDGAGALVEVLVEADSTNLPRGARAESWMHIETESLTDTDTDTEASDGLAGRITQILSDVRDVVADAAAMEHTARELAATLRADPPPAAAHRGAGRRAAAGVAGRGACDLPGLPPLRVGHLVAANRPDRGARVGFRRDVRADDGRVGRRPSTGAHRRTETQARTRQVRLSRQMYEELGDEGKRASTPSPRSPPRQCSPGVATPQVTTELATTKYASSPVREAMISPPLSLMFSARTVSARAADSVLPG